jgi:hypothetical protein
MELTIFLFSDQWSSNFLVSGGCVNWPTREDRYTKRPTIKEIRSNPKFLSVISLVFKCVGHIVCYILC